MSAPPPEDPDDRTGRGPESDAEPPDELDFDAEFERMVAHWTPSGPSAVEPVETSPDDESTEHGETLEPEPVVEPVETSDERLRDLFRGAWPEEPPAPAEDAEEHYVPPPPPPFPRPEGARLVAWTGLLGAPLLALVLLVLGALPQWVAFFLFCWFTGGFGYLVATMRSGGRDGWDDGARV